MKTLLNTFYYLLLATICGIGLLVLASLMPVRGIYAIKVVKSGSMEPRIPVGSVVVDKPESAYHIGDVITFGADTKTQTPTTHRIVGISGTGADEMFTTKGDANNAPDETTTSVRDVHGKVILVVPYFGYLLAFAKTKYGFLLLVALPAGLICLEELFKIFREVQRMRREKKRNTAVAPQTQLFAVRDIEPEEQMFVTDLRVTERDTDTHQHFKKPALPRAGQAIVASLGLLFVVSMTSFAHTSGYTAAYYANSVTSAGNKMQGSDDFGTTTIAVAPQTFSPLLFAGVQGLVTGAPDTSDDSGTTTPGTSATDSTSTPDVTPPPSDASSTTDVTPPPVDPLPIEPPAVDPPPPPPTDTGSDATQ